MNLASPFPDIVIGLSYLALPTAMVILAWDNKSIWARRILWMYSAFIVSCGIGHCIDAYYLFRGECSAGSWLKSIVNYSTAILSLLTACTIIPMLPTYIQALKAPFSLEHIRAMLDKLEK